MRLDHACASQASVRTGIEKVVAYLQHNINKSCAHTVRRKVFNGIILDLKTGPKIANALQNGL